MPEEQPKEPIQEKKKFFSDLFSFLKEDSVIGLAIGVISAQITKDFIDAFVKNLFWPLLNLVIPNEKFKDLKFVIKGSVFDIGAIINAGLTFLIVLIMLYVIVKKILKKDELLKKK